MKTLSLFLVLFSVTLWGAGTQYKGEFGQILSSAKPCDGIFGQTKYLTKVFKTGPSGLTAVVYFQGEGNQGFLHGLNFVGRCGGFNDIGAERKIVTQEGTYVMRFDGLIDYQFFIFTMKAKYYPSGSETAQCEASAEYSGFH